MFDKKNIFLLLLIFLLTSCADTWNSVKRGLTGKKMNTTDEFLVEKKDPLILPPNFDELPTPGVRNIGEKETFSIEESLGTSSSEGNSSSVSSTEQSILQEIRKK
tara:strand:+ start:88 stop:402 length:315 start_codon:yes stop_codon:yes gene_type:complete